MTVMNNEDPALPDELPRDEKMHLLGADYHCTVKCVCGRKTYFTRRELDRDCFDQLSAPLIALIELQRFFEANAHEPGRMPGNDYYSQRLMEIVRAAELALPPNVADERQPEAKP